MLYDVRCSARAGDTLFCALTERHDDIDDAPLLRNIFVVVDAR